MSNGREDRIGAGPKRLASQALDGLRFPKHGRHGGGDAGQFDAGSASRRGPQSLME
jgi:hypothetical protein